MDSLLAAYGADDDEEEQRVKEEPEADEVITTTSSLFKSLPLPKNKGVKKVEFRPQVDISLLEDEEEKKARKRPPPKEENGDGASAATLGGIFVLPAPKHTNVLGGGAVLGGGGRRTLVETSSSEAAVQEQEQVIPSNYDDAYQYGDPSQAYQYTTDPSQAHQYTTDPSQAHQYTTNPSQAYYTGDPSQSQPHYEQVEDPVAKADRRRDRGNNATFVQISQDQLTANRPREDQMRATGIAFGSLFDKSSQGEKPSKLHRKKHQIGSLLYDMKEKELELAERRAKGSFNKSQTYAKYGW